MPHHRDTPALFERYIDVCNRAIARNKDRFWYRKAVDISEALWGGEHFRAVVYDHEPEHVEGVFTIRFDADTARLKVLPTDDHPVVFKWHVPLDYLEDVVSNADWYVENPLQLDWSWMKARARDAVRNKPGTALALGALVAAAAVTLARRSLR